MRNDEEFFYNSNVVNRDLNLGEYDLFSLIKSTNFDFEIKPCDFGLIDTTESNSSKFNSASYHAHENSKRILTT